MYTYVSQLVHELICLFWKSRYINTYISQFMKSIVRICIIRSYLVLLVLLVSSVSFFLLLPRFHCCCLFCC